MVWWCVGVCGIVVLVVVNSSVLYVKVVWCVLVCIVVLCVLVCGIVVECGQIPWCYK